MPRRTPPPVAGLALPARIGVRSADGPRSALCLGPDEWVLETAEADRDALAASLAELAGRVAMSAVEISDREITYRLEGPGVLDLLATGCPRDLARMPVGSGTRSVFDTVQVVLTREAEHAFRPGRLALLRAARPGSARPRHPRARRRPLIPAQPGRRVRARSPVRRGQEWSELGGRLDIAVR